MCQMCKAGRCWAAAYPTGRLLLRAALHTSPLLQSVSNSCFNRVPAPGKEKEPVSGESVGSSLGVGDGGWGASLNPQSLFLYKVDLPVTLLSVCGHLYKSQLVTIPPPSLALSGLGRPLSRLFPR